MCCHQTSDVENIQQISKVQAGIPECNDVSVSPCYVLQFVQLESNKRHKISRCSRVEGYQPVLLLSADAVECKLLRNVAVGGNRHSFLWLQLFPTNTVPQAFQVVKPNPHATRIPHENLCIMVCTGRINPTLFLFNVHMFTVRLALAV